MPPFLIPVLAAEVVYAIACALVGSQPNAPLWLRWPTLAWNRMLYGPPPAPAAPKPDHAKIARLERELGIGFVEERPMRRSRVCLVKDCGADTVEIRTWSGQLAMRLHNH